MEKLASVIEYSWMIRYNCQAVIHSWVIEIRESFWLDALPDTNQLQIREEINECWNLEAALVVVEFLPP